MDSTVPDHLKQEQQALEAEIREAFKGVSREGGVSWSEAKIIDGYSGPDVNLALAHARVADPDQSWEQLINSATWDDQASLWSFLNAIGFRYYLAPAMIRYSKDPNGSLDYALDRPICEDELRRLLTRPQLDVVVSFIRFMIKRCEAIDLQDAAEEWRGVLAQWRAQA